MSMEKLLKRNFKNNYYSRMIVDYSLKYRRVMLLCVILVLVIIVNTAISVYRPVFQGRFVDILTNYSEKSLSEYGLYFGVFIFLLFLNNVLVNVHGFISNLVSEEIAANMRQGIIKKLCNIRIEFFLRTDFPQFLPKIDKDIEIVKQYGIVKIISLLADVIVLIAVVPYMFSLNIPMTCGIVGIFLLVPISNHIFSAIIEKYSETVLQKYKKILKKVNNFFDNWLIIRVFSCKNYVDENYKKDNLEYKYASNKRNFVMLLYSTINIIVQVLSSVVIWGLGGYFVFTGKMTIGIVMAFMGYQSVIMKPILNIASFYGDYNVTKAAIKDFYQFIDQQDQVLIGEEIKRIENLKMKHVYFKYGDRRILEDINLEFEKDKIYAIEGESGQGKTTLLNIIMGLLNPEAGNIYINDVNINKINLETYWSALGYVYQQGKFFEDSIDKNIDINEKYTYGLKREIANKIDILEEIQQMDDAWNTKIRMNPSNLSGGQFQRLDIIRNILKNPSLVLFDEPTSSLDNSRRQLFYKMLEELKQKCIVIVVTHDAELLKRADKVYRISNKKCEEIVT